VVSVDGFLNCVADWGRSDSRITAVILIGSQARRTATPTSDVDLVIITDNAPALLAEHDWARSFGAVQRWQAEGGERFAACVFGTPMVWKWNSGWLPLRG